MKINKIILKNFSAVKNAMSANEITIDFNNSINKICLLIGPNGSGKTTILSMLHPFADVGNLDNRNGYNLILEGKDGYKEIEIVRGEDIYVIKHFYTPQKEKNHSVKSYIFKNYVDLNINGNVTSFKEIIKEELQIEPDYLKLIRLGSNVTSMIDLSATERKNFMSKIMDDIGIYLEYYKSVNQKLRDLDQLMTVTIDRINKLGIIDRDEFEKEIKETEQEISSLNKRYEEILVSLTKIGDKISTYGNIDEFYSNGRELTLRYNKMIKIINNKDSIESTDINFYITKIDKLEKEINSYKNELNSNVLLIQNTLNHLNSQVEQLHLLEVQLSKDTNTDREIDIMNENLKNTRLKLRELEGNVIDFSPLITKQEFDTFYVFIKNIQKILSRTYEFGKKPITKVIELLENNKSVMNYINSHLIDIDESVSDRTPLFLTAVKNRCSFLFSKEEKFFCENDCSARDLYIQLKEIFMNSEIDDKNEEISFYHDMEYVYGNIKTIIPQFSDYSYIIEKLPDDLKDQFSMKNIYNKIKKLEYIYDEKKMNEFLSLITEYDNYLIMKATYEEQEKQLSQLSNISNSSFIKEQIDLVSNSIEEERSKMVTLKNRNIELESIIKESEYSLELLVDTKDTIEKFDEVNDEYNKYIKDRDDLEKLESEESTLINEQNQLNLRINQINVDLQKKISTINMFNTLLDDKTKFSKIYDNMLLVKTALSSKSGIPLRIISSYLENTNQITNDFLDIVYDGKIYIDDFQITSTEFSIPFFNKGVRLSDVKYASQGELSFLSIALSFALSSQVLSKYNIMLLDEIDGPLDIKNREKFIKILEAQIDRISSEQSFLITHNAMFSSYPVDIIDLSFINHSDEYPNANFINIERK